MAAPVTLITYCDWPILTSVGKSIKHHVISHVFVAHYISALDQNTEIYLTPGLTIHCTL